MPFEKTLPFIEKTYILVRKCAKGDGLALLWAACLKESEGYT